MTAQTVTVTIPAAFAQNRIVQIDKDEVRFEILAERIRQVMLNRTDKSVFIRSDGAVTVQHFISVTDKLREAGVEKVGISTRPPDR